MESREKTGIRSLILLVTFSAVVVGFYSCNTTGIAEVFQFRASVQPENAGTITPADGEFDAGEEVEIRAEASDGYRFVGWDGDLEGSENPVTVSFDSDLTITAMFELREYPLNITIEGEGTVREEVLEDKSKDYEHGTVVELTAEPGKDWRFVRWEGDIDGNENPATITVEDEKNVSAIFERREYALNIETEGEGMVKEEVVEQKEKDYESGTMVELTAEPEDGWRFEGWKGDLEGDENPSTIMIDEEKNVTAVFEPDTFPLNIHIEGEGKVKEEVVKDKAKDYVSGTTVQLTADPEEDWRFLRWEGDLEGSENPQIIRVDKEKSVTAVFESMIVVHGPVDGVTPTDDSGFEERSYITIQADWDGPGGDKRWLGKNLGANGEPKSVDDDDPDRSGWYFRFNREQAFYHDGSFGRAEGFPTGPASRSTIREESDWEVVNDPCRKLLGGSWRIPTDDEWKAAASSGTDKLNLHAAGRLSPSFGHPLDSRGNQGVYWSSTQFNSHNAIVIEINRDGEISNTEPLQKHYGVPVRCIEE